MPGAQREQRGSGGAAGDAEPAPASKRLPRELSEDRIELLKSADQLQTVGGSFSAVSKPLIARVGEFFSICQDHLRDVHSFAPLRP